MSILLKLSVAGALIICMASCKKKDDPTGNNNTHIPAGPFCMISSVVSTFNACKDSTEVYGAEVDRISRLVNFNNCPAGTPGPTIVTGKRFIYDGDKVFIIDTAYQAGGDTLIVDAASLRILDHRRSGSSGGSISTHFEYSAAGMLQSSVTSYASVPFDTTLYTFSNGDLVLQVDLQMGHRDTFRYSYYTDKPVPANAYVTQNGLRYGSAFIYKNAHLLKGPVDAQGALLVAYIYDTDSYKNISRVIRANTTGTMPRDTTVFHYACIVE